MADLIKVSLQGTMPGGEVFSVNPVWKVTPGSEVNYNDCAALVAAINGVAITPNVLLMITSSCAWTGCRVESRRFDGTLEDLAEGARATPAVGSGTGNKTFQTSLVQSLRTTSPGGSGRGRLYWPATAMNIDATTLRLSSSNVTTFGNALMTYLGLLQTAINGAIDPPAALGVWSRTTQAVNIVNQLIVGDILDTQRRRRDNLPESYQTFAWVP